MTDEKARGAMVRQPREGVLATIHLDGRPQLSSMPYGFDGAGTLRVSTSAGQVKARNLRHDPRAAMHAAGADFWRYAVADQMIAQRRPVVSWIYGIVVTGGPRPLPMAGAAAGPSA